MEIHVQLTSSSSQSRAVVRGHEVTVDRPTEKGGQNSGPMGGELLVAALGGCFLSTLRAAAVAREVELGQVDCIVTAQAGGSPTRFTHFHLSVDAPLVPTQTLDHLLVVAHRGCLIVATLNAASEVLVTRKPSDQE